MPAAASHNGRQSPTRPKSTLMATASSGAASGPGQEPSTGFQKDRDRRRDVIICVHPDSRSKPTGSRLKRRGPVSCVEGNRQDTEERQPPRHGRRRLARGRGSAAARRDENPVRIGGSSIARKGPVIGLLDRVLRVAVDDAAVHRARHIDLVRDQLNRHLRGAPQQFGFDDIRAVQAARIRVSSVSLAATRSSIAVTNCWKTSSLSKGRNPALSAFANAVTIISKAMRSTLEELRWVEARVGSVNLVQSFRDRIGRRGGRRRASGAWSGFDQSRSLCPAAARARRTNSSRRRSFPVRRPRTLRSRSTKKPATIANRMMSKYC